MKLILRVLSGKKYGQRIVVGRGQASTVGRSNAAQYSFDDDHMSSLHFEVENFGSYAEVRDLRSTNRTWLNNNFVASAPLKHGDRLRAGKTVLAVEIEHTAIVDEAGLPPKPPLLESTSQVAVPQSKVEPIAAIAPGTAGDPENHEAPRHQEPEELAGVDAKLRPNFAATQPPSTLPPSTLPQPLAQPVLERPERPLVVATPVHRPDSIVPAPHQPIQQPAQQAVHQPLYQQPASSKPATQPPVHQPPTYQPPVHQPPVHQPPAHQPPAHQPPAHQPLGQQPGYAAPVSAAANAARPNMNGGNAVKASSTPPAPPVDYRSEFESRPTPTPAHAVPAVEHRRQTGSPIESGEFSAPPERRLPPENRQRSGSNPIVESSSLYLGPAIEVPGDKRRFRQYERIGDFQYLHNLRSVITHLHTRRAVRIVAHFKKIGVIAPQLSDVVPLYPEFPGATTHWPVSLTYRDWESPSVQTVASRLCSNDALLVLVGEYNSDLSAAAQAVGIEGVRGFCEPGGYLGWCSPTCFNAFVQLLGTKYWGDVLGPAIDGAIMCNPMHQEVLWAFAAECLESDLKSLGFTTVV